ncbi:uncharacterized protein BCR38DRAFT_407110 [Pseudomassariella vexata]|uniref:Uncharacterized protein n=1 Tax=Pseudomassariella vexata TaxID=1141098 RepID=A0A1Y2E6M9_9PEZI|nr:uncharacterized protein BCR38DRAFT_407110 [Pseudomassariella vexata]ORY67097.1 hypothetical protein BCR38DRAFT_407110 [Pseudomassariella vexata]
MGGHVEAHSLATLNALASNPPQYPTKPSEQRREPLTLYISRVPGTRDIILSPFKPQIKNVTAEDVASSLYYVHFNTAEDDLMTSKLQTSNPSPRTSQESSRSGPQIQRKPVPPPARKSDVVDPALTESHPAFRTGTPVPPYGADNQDAGPWLQPSAQLMTSSHDGSAVPSERKPPPPVHRKPLGPRVLTSENLNKMLPEPPVQPPTYSETPRSPVAPDLPPKPSQNHYHHPPLLSNPSAPLTVPLLPNSRPPSPFAPSSISPNRSPSSSPKQRQRFTPYSLTLIRRDPSSGQQWNVGRVSSFQLEHPELLLPDEKHIPSPSINISLETSGYSKFRNMPSVGRGAIDIREIRESLDMIRPGGASAAVATSVNQSPNRQHTRPEPNHSSFVTNGAAFDRQVKMTYAPSFAATLKHAFRREPKHHSSLSASDDLPVSPRLSQPSHSRSGSAVSALSSGGEFDPFDVVEAPVITTPAPGLKPQGYMFASPWDGRCEFRTGNGGRSLRCRHILPSFGTGGGMWNPLVGGGDANGERPETPQKESKVKGHDISELRFNLPSNEIFANEKTKLPNEGRERARDRIFNSMINKTEDDVDDDEYYSYGYDLSLGKEKAGGGNRGKRAKMGKLIIWDDGLKMLDLVVAANVGVWWGVWERRGE